jgi:hypothetical protein
MKQNPMQKALAALQNHPRCGAYARQTGKSCLGWAMKNGRCRMHGGKSTGRPLIHGNLSKPAIAQRKADLAIIRKLRLLINSQCLEVV